MEKSPDNNSAQNAQLGENLSTDMRRPFARSANRLLRNLRGRDQVLPLGEHGDVPVDHIRFRDALEEGHLKAYIRQEATDPKVIIPVVVALGVVATGMRALKYHKK